MAAGSPTLVARLHELHDLREAALADALADAAGAPRGDITARTADALLGAVHRTLFRRIQELNPRRPGRRPDQRHCHRGGGQRLRPAGTLARRLRRRVSRASPVDVAPRRRGARPVAADVIGRNGRAPRGAPDGRRRREADVPRHL
jgi:hypothetical protein